MTNSISISNFTPVPTPHTPTNHLVPTSPLPHGRPIPTVAVLPVSTMFFLLALGRWRVPSLSYGRPVPTMTVLQVTTVLFLLTSGRRRVPLHPHGRSVPAAVALVLLRIILATRSLPLKVLRNRLAKVYVYTSIVHQHVVHLEEGLVAVLWLVELDEGVLQRRARPPVPNHLATVDLAETSEDDSQVLKTNIWQLKINILLQVRKQLNIAYLICRNRIELAHEEDVVRWLLLRVAKIANHLKNLCVGPHVLFLHLPPNLLGVLALVLVHRLVECHLGVKLKQSDLELCTRYS